MSDLKEAEGMLEQTSDMAFLKQLQQITTEEDNPFSMQ